MAGSDPVLSTSISGISANSPPPVVDQTGLQGSFDFILEQLPAGMFSLFPKPPDPDNPLTNPKGAPFLNAVREQLGLKLERLRGEVRTLIIDHVERPPKN